MNVVPKRFDVFARFDNGEWILSNLPDWYKEDGSKLTEEEWNQHGYFRYLHINPKVDLEFKLSKDVEQNHSSKWIFENNCVRPTYNFQEVGFEISMIRALEYLNEEFEKSVSFLHSKYPESERDTWSKQEQETLSWELDPSIDTPFMKLIAESRNIEVSELLKSTLKNIKRYNIEIGTLVGLRQRYRDLIESSKTVKELVEILSKLDFYKEVIEEK